MLVLTRRLMEKLYIGEDICVTVVRLEGGQVRLGIEAPREIPVLRGELKPRESESSGTGMAGTVIPEAIPAGALGSGPHVEIPADPAAGQVRSQRSGARGTGIRRRAPFR
jgi:carbon storage regulator